MYSPSILRRRLVAAFGNAYTTVDINIDLHMCSCLLISQISIIQRPSILLAPTPPYGNLSYWPRFISWCIENFLSGRFESRRILSMLRRKPMIKKPFVSNTSRTTRAIIVVIMNMVFSASCFRQVLAANYLHLASSTMQERDGLVLTHDWL